MAKDFLEVMDEAENGVILRDAARRLPNFNKKLSGFVKLLTNEAGYPSHQRTYLMKEAALATTDFPILFGTVLERTLIAKYSVVNTDWRTYIKVGTQNDFRPANAVGVYGLQSGLSEVKQQGEYKADKLGEGTIPISLKKYGRRFGLSWEALINDDLGAFNDIAERLANAAARTEQREAAKLIVQASGPNTGLYAASPGITHPIDKVKVINKLALALTADNLASAIATLKAQKDVDGEPLLVNAVHLVVPPALEFAMLQILSAGSLIVSGGDATAGVAGTVRTSVNVVAQMGIIGHTNPYLPIIDTSGNGNKTWYLFADLGTGYAAKLNFLRGHESPELVMKSPNKVTLAGGNVSPFEGNFEEDTVHWRVRHVLGGAQFDPRMTIASVAP